jgi:hypothetical protein
LDTFPTFSPRNSANSGTCIRPSFPGKDSQKELENVRKNQLRDKKLSAVTETVGCAVRRERGNQKKKKIEDEVGRTNRKWISE